MKYNERKMLCVDGSGKCKKALIVATVGGFLPKFEMGDVRILQELGYEVHYAANLQNPVYRFDGGELEAAGIRLHDIAIEKSPFALGAHRRVLEELVALIEAEGISLIHCHTPVGGYLGRMAGERVRRRRKGNGSCLWKRASAENGTPWQAQMSAKDGDMRQARLSARDGNIRKMPGGVGNDGIKVMYTSHGFHFYKGAPFPEGFVFKCVERYLAHFTDVLVTIDKEDYENARRFRLRPGGRVYQIPGVGLDMEKFRPPTEKERGECRERLGIPGDAFFLLSVGELNQNKNHGVVLKALNLMRLPEGDWDRRYHNVRKIVSGAAGLMEKPEKNARGFDADNMRAHTGQDATSGNGRECLPKDRRDGMSGYKCGVTGKKMLYGICGEGGARAQLEAEIRSFGLEKQVMLYGYRDPRPYLAAADAFVFPSRREGLGMAALEALAMGVPVIAADNRGSREYMQHGRNGYVFVWNDPEGCAKGIRQLVEMDAKERTCMRHRCRESVRGFDIRKAEEAMRGIYGAVDGSL